MVKIAHLSKNRRKHERAEVAVVAVAAAMVAVVKGRRREEVVR